MTAIVLDAPAKECTSCGDVKVLGDFHRDRRSPDGYSGWCRACRADNDAERYAGFRRRDRVDRQRDGIFVCLCEVAYAGPKLCRGCGWPVVARMHPDVQARMAAKHPWFADQVVIDEAMAVAT